MRFRRDAGSAAAAGRLRPLLFGAAPIDAWPSEQENGSEPWQTFLAARASFSSGSRDDAIGLWSDIARRTDIESRHTLQAWHFLRGAGVAPPADQAARVLGAAAEVAVGSEHDLLVAYSDGSARYLNHGGGAAVVEADEASTIAEPVRAWLNIAQQLANAVDVWDGDDLPQLPVGHTRVLMLTAGGYRFGQGPDGQLRSDPGANAFLWAATQLLLAITKLSGI